MFSEQRPVCRWPGGPVSAGRAAEMPCPARGVGSCPPSADKEMSPATLPRSVGVLPKVWLRSFSFSSGGGWEQMVGESVRGKRGNRRSLGKLGFGNWWFKAAPRPLCLTAVAGPPVFKHLYNPSFCLHGILWQQVSEFYYAASVEMMKLDIDNINSQPYIQRQGLAWATEDF